MKEKHQILIVDDDPILLEQAENILSPAYTVSMAISGKQAIEYLEEGNLPSLILLDLLMPCMDGHETLDRIRRIPRCKEIPVIFLTAVNSPEFEAKCLEEGASDYITKPFSPAVLLARISLSLENVRRFHSGYELDESRLTELSEPLTEAERKVLRLMVRAYSNREIAKELHYSYDYVKKLASQVLGKLNLENRREVKKYRK